jgi:hypothetical protein
MSLLELNINPDIRGYQHHAFTLGIILKEKENYFWLYNNYIQLVYSKKGGLDTFNFNMEFATHQTPFIRNTLDDYLLDLLSIDKIDYIITALEHGKYVEMCVDEYYIPHRRAYMKQHFIHDILIYGYDTVDKCFTAIGYDDNMQYSVTKIPTELLRESKPTYLELLELKSNYKYCLDIPRILLHVGQYLNLIPDYLQGDQYYDDIKFGLEACYSLFESYSELLDQLEICPIVQVYLFMEHKKCMYLRMKYIFNTYNLNEETLLEKYNENVNNAVKLLNLIIKYNFRASTDTANRIKKYFLKIIDNERSLLTEFYKILENIYENSK